MAAYIIYFFTGTFSNVNNFNREELYAIFLRASLTDFGDHTSYDNLKCAVYDLTVKSIFVCKLPSGITVDNYAARRAACSSAIRCS